jgi:ribonuclease T2
MSWTPAFCEDHGYVPECRKESPADARRFTLHGLWHDDYCGVSQKDIVADEAHDWNSLPEPDLSPATRAELDEIMPGTQSLLERHEWIQHGTCSGVSADTYFHRAALFVGTINNTAVGDLLAGRSGKRLDRSDLERAFDTAFGKGAGKRVSLDCTDVGGRHLITGVQLALYGDVLGNGSISELVRKAHPIEPGCSGGILDPVGRQ